MIKQTKVIARCSYAHFDISYKRNETQRNRQWLISLESTDLFSETLSDPYNIKAQTAYRYNKSTRGSLQSWDSASLQKPVLKKHFAELVLSSLSEVKVNVDFNKC